MNRELLVTRVGAHWFAFDVASVEAAVDAPVVHAVATRTPALCGQFVHRERTVPLYDLALLCGIARDGEGAGTALVFAVGARTVAVRVDDVGELVRPAGEALQAVPGGMDPVGVLRAVTLTAGRVTGVVETDALVARVLRAEEEAG
ncbi:MAG: chemotaxis protein CheW [Gemmatimonadaceae bacterium]|nr:chemotaxis protein CheW [Gemmatimonadaceae bacterium]